MALEEGDVVLCTVDRIAGTIVFVKKEGSIIFSEVAPGRIRNIRDYIIPKKKIVCKVIRISKNHIDLSLRRVTQKEKKEVLEQYKQEKSYRSVIESVVGKEESQKAIEEIKKQERLYNFIEESKENPKNLEKLMGKEKAKKILDIIKIQKPKIAVVKKEFYMHTAAPNGLDTIKGILGDIKDAEIKYIAAGKYSIKTKAENLKSASSRIKEITEDIEKKAKKQKVEFSIKEK